jgi:xanthine dehydrogenase YagS FAD-binding subunit
MAGGTTLYDLMKLNVEMPTTVVDLTGLRDLATFDTSGSQELMFGALAPMSDVAADPRLVRDYPALSESLWRAASQQLRNMATLGGNLLQRTRCAYFRGGEPYACNKRTPGSGCAAIGGLDRGHAVLGGSTSCIAVYPGDWSVALVAFDAQVDTLSPRGERTIPLESLHREPGDTPHIETTLAPDELIVRIRVPATPLGRASTYHKIRDRESYAFALASAAVALHMDGETVREARVALGGVATRPWRARSAERALVGRSLNAATARAAGDEAFVDARAGRDNGFKIELGVRTVADALMIAKGRIRA